MSSVKPVIGIVSWDFLHAKGGMGRSMQWMGEALGSEVDVVIGCPGDRLSVTGYRGEVTSLLSFTKRFGGHTLFSLCLPFVLNQWIRKHQIDLLIIPGGPGGVFLWMKPKVPYVCSVYHVYEQQARLVPGQWWKKLFIPLEWWTYRRAKAILSFNEDTRMILGKIYKIPRDRIQSLPHAVSDVWKVTAPVQKKKGLCVCVARLEARKGVEILVEAWNKVLAEIPDARLLIVGQGIGARAIDEKIKRMRGIVRIPALLFPDLVSLVQQAEVAVCPAYLEGFGLAAAEAMRAGTAVVAADSEGLRCLLRYRLPVTGYQECGFLCESGNADDCAKVIINVLKNDSLRETVVQTALQAAQREFDQSSASAFLQKVMNDMVTNHS